MGITAEIILGSTDSATGVPILASGPVSWQLTEGTKPVIRQFQLAPIHHDQVMAYANGGLSKSVSLKIGDGSGAEITFKQLFVINSSPGPNPYIKSVTIADRRWLWHYCHIGPRRYNWRRQVGRKRLTSPGEIADLGDAVEGNVVYALYSLNKSGGNVLNQSQGEIWKPAEVVRNVLKDVFEFEKEARGLGSDLTLPDIPAPGSLPIENLLIDDPGDQAINKTLGYLPQCAIYLDPSGDAKVKVKTSGNEKNVVKNNVLGYEKVDKGHVAMVRNNLVRPRKIHVQFEREVEVRFDFFEQESAGSTTTSTGEQQMLATNRQMFNVLPITDFTLDDYVMGEWVTFDEALQLWEAEPKPSGVNLNLDYPLIRKGMVPFLDIWSGFLQLGRWDPDNNWVGRLSAIQQHYRKTFQIAQSWIDASYEIRPERVGILNPETGTKAPALALGNHTRLGSQKRFRMNLLQGEQLSYAMPVICYPAASPDEAASRSEEPAIKYPIVNTINLPHAGSVPIVNSPATVSVIDSDQGIVSVNYIPDNNRMYEMMLPSLLTMSEDTEGNSGPGANPTLIKRPITMDCILKASLDNFPELSKNHKLLVILTCVPGTWQSFNNENKNGYKNYQLEEIEVGPSGPLSEDLKNMVSANCKETIDEAQGPDMYLRIGAGIATAKIVWQDSLWQETSKIFGFIDEKPNTDKLCINKTQDNQGASLTNVALAAAARVYESLADRLQGDKTSSLSKGARPEGWIDTVSYSVAPTGEVSTRVDLPESVPQIDLLSYLDSATRAVVLKLGARGKS